MTTIRDPSADSATEPAAPYRHQRIVDGRAIEIEETSGTAFAEATGRVSRAPAAIGSRSPTIAVGLAILTIAGGLAVVAGRRMGRARRARPSFPSLAGRQETAAHVA